MLAWAAETFGDALIVASNMQDAVLVDLAAKARPGVDVLFLDTGYHFAETIGTRDAVETVYDVRIVNAHAGAHGRRAGLAARQGPVRPRPEPVLRAAQGRAAAEHARRLRRLGHRRAPGRGARPGPNTPLVTYDEKFGLVKINPIAAWTDEEMDAYIAEHGVLVNPLVSEGYPSIGCAPCTAKPAPGADKRSGRWAGTGKIECGLHVS